MKHYKITITGKVQGVWYRKNTLNKTKELNIKGFVKNLDNGDVYIEAEGHENELNTLLDWCAKGPEFSKVDTVCFKESDLEYFEHFEILH
ncbi:acylphosphatase [Aquimarina muelleri]|uniref:acylphosphatase n=1 Tax=Aquimarina muelleri TaxID=279356 RepID=UPI0003F62F86|nr:acylphosphatase [Aquimarina muelleri]